jgi:WD40 repeat protein
MFAHAPRRSSWWISRVAFVCLFLTGASSARASQLLVSSAGNNSILRYDGSTGAFLGIFASGGLLDVPLGLTIGPDGNVYVLSSGNGKILVYDTAGTFVRTFAAGAELDRPVFGAFGPDGNLYVSNDGNNERVFRYDGTTGAFLGTFASDREISGIFGLTFGPDGNLYVSSYLNTEILRFDGTTGAFLGVFAFLSDIVPLDLKFGPNGNLYVAGDSLVERFQGTTGTFLGRSPNLPGSFAGLSFGPDGLLYVSSYESNIIVRYDPSTLTPLGTFASGGGLDTPVGLVFVSTPLEAPEPASLVLVTIGLVTTSVKRRYRLARSPTR